MRETEASRKKKRSSRIAARISVSKRKKKQRRVTLEADVDDYKCKYTLNYVKFKEPYQNTVRRGEASFRTENILCSFVVKSIVEQFIGKYFAAHKPQAN